ncbi:hypothetical protein Anas_12504 [Armadillidium nasatum]|uniref:Uncharacterized protein n=1 Tax=Armadillidium nasatum TaxID=96803 RepID=A0A5N5TFB2_9CRUS|nr:hypothetical protein Anas_12504 [Armadillidium nasatum]
MDDMIEGPDLAEDDFEDIEYADVKEEFVDPEEGIYNIKEDFEYRESMRTEFSSNFIKVEPMVNSNKKDEVPMENSKKKDGKELMRNSKKDEVTKETETPSQKLSNVENSRNSSTSSTRCQRQQAQKSSRSLLKARRPRLGYCGRYDAFGLYVAKKLENLPDRMSIFAQKMISDVLFEAEMGSLNRHSKVIGQRPL